MNKTRLNILNLNSSFNNLIKDKYSIGKLVKEIMVNYYIIIIEIK